MQKLIMDKKHGIQELTQVSIQLNKMCHFYLFKTDKKQVMILISSFLLSSQV